MTARDHRVRIALAGALLVTALAACADNRHNRHDRHDRQHEVADRGRTVMPFDLDRTTHRFAKSDTGGVQTVVADDPADDEQIALVRQHLRSEADRFRGGDFSDPTRIHGDDMPGLQALRSSAGRIAIGYEDTVDGGRITYTTQEPALVAALHAWFDAQVDDHGEHAEHG
jgi:hypothetical protein